MEVHCTIENCQWWDDNYCVAKGILITSDHIGQELPERLDYKQTRDIVDEHGETPVDTCMETCCKTFTVRRD